jgi:hypothetical protein
MMPDERPQEPFDLQLVMQQPIFTRSNAFRLLYSNFVRMRVAPGECMITFATVTDVPVQVPVQGQNQVANITTRNIIQEELAVALPWPVLKTLVMQLNDVLRAIENQVGPIKGTKSTATSDQLVKAYEQVLQQMLEKT